MPSRGDSVRDYLLSLQSSIVAKMEALDGGSFLVDEWKRSEGGGGISRILEGGKLLERGGVGFSHVSGTQLPPSASALRPGIAGRPWEAMGTSLVFHPVNPHVPTVHMNVRFFAAGDVWVVRRRHGPYALLSGRGGLRAFPSRQSRCTCELPRPSSALQEGCDDYFFLKHRNEARGVGGTFFDDFDEGGFDNAFAVMRAVGDAFLSGICSDRGAPSQYHIRRT